MAEYATKKDLKQFKEEIIRHNQVLYEKFHGDIKIIGEGWNGTRQKVDATFDIVDELKEDVEDLKILVGKNTKDITKNTKDISILKLMAEKNTKDINIIKSDITIIKNDLKQKVDREEFMALEKRVILLENKFKRT